MVELTEEEADILLQSAVENQLTIQAEIFNMQAHAAERHEVGHVMAKLQRLDRVIVELEKKLFLP
jgi:UDP-N-acetyl-D-mannosaminuronate dehydrogenase